MLGMLQSIRGAIVCLKYSFMFGAADGSIHVRLTLSPLLYLHFRTSYDTCKQNVNVPELTPGVRNALNRRSCATNWLTHLIGVGWVVGHAVFPAAHHKTHTPTAYEHTHALITAAPDGRFAGDCATGHLIRILMRVSDCGPRTRFWWGGGSLGWPAGLRVVVALMAVGRCSDRRH